MSVFSLETVCKTYNPGLFKPKVTAVRDLSLNVEEGEVYGLIGPNGAGKSTTLRMILGLIRQDQGRIEFRGKPIRETAFHQEIGYLPENPYLYDHLTLLELLRFCGRASGVPERQAEERAALLIERLNLGAARKRPLRSFSKGMLQRAAICFALLHDPSVVILDEPMSGLDPIGRKMVFDLVQELKSEGKTIFFCSHILSDVERLCDRIGMLVNGRLTATFDKEDLWAGTGDYVHLSVGQLDVEQKEALSAFVLNVNTELNGDVLTVEADKLNALLATLQKLSIDIQGSRGEMVSLEDLFMRVVKSGEDTV